MHKVLGFLLLLMFITAGFFIISAVLMATWNYTIPRLITSIEGSNTYSDIDYQTSMVFTILLAVLFGGGGLMVYAPIKGGKSLTKSKSNKKAMTSYTVNEENLSGGPFY